MTSDCQAGLIVLVVVVIVAVGKHMCVCVIVVACSYLSRNAEVHRLTQPVKDQWKREQKLSVKEKETEMRG